MSAAEKSIFHPSNFDLTVNVTYTESGVPKDKAVCGTISFNRNTLFSTHDNIVDFKDEILSTYDNIAGCKLLLKTAERENVITKDSVTFYADTMVSTNRKHPFAGNYTITDKTSVFAVVIEVVFSEKK